MDNKRKINVPYTENEVEEASQMAEMPASIAGSAQSAPQLTQQVTSL
jgi:hypothetical protein